MLKPNSLDKIDGLTATQRIAIMYVACGASIKTAAAQVPDIGEVGIRNALKSGKGRKFFKEMNEKILDSMAKACTYQVIKNIEISDNIKKNRLRAIQRKPPKCYENRPIIKDPDPQDFDPSGR